MFFRLLKFKALYYSIAFLVGGFFILVPSRHTLAAELFMTTAARSVAPGDQFVVQVLLNTEQEEVNALEATLEFPAELRVAAIREDNSLIRWWIEPPAIKPLSRGKATIAWRGLFSGGLTVTDGIIMSVVFAASTDTAAFSRTSDSFNFTVRQARVFKNDGLGTPLPVKAAPLLLQRERAPRPPARATLSPDTTPPEPFRPAISRTPTLFNGAWFVVFVARDSESGIASYEVQETQTPTPGPTAWIPAESPHRLADQNRRGFVHIRARDQAGNERLATLSPAPTEKAGYARLLVWCILGVLMIIVLWYSQRLWHRRRLSS